MTGSDVVYYDPTEDGRARRDPAGWALGLAGDRLAAVRASPGTP